MGVVFVIRLYESDRAQADELLAASVAEGSGTFHVVTASAVHRLLARGSGAIYGRGLFDPEEFRRLANQIRDTNATAELLGRSWIALRAQQFERSQAQRQFSELSTSFRIFEEGPRLHPMPPTQAIEYFRKLVPMPGIDPKRFGQWLEREAFTLAATAERILQEKIKAEIQKRLDTGQGIRQAPKDIQDLLDAAGVSVRNPQYAEMVFRTNMNESYLTGAQRELAAHTRTFPVWQYTNPDDGRSREHHADKDGRYYPSTVPFTRVRGTNIADLANCRCGFIPVDRVEWARLESLGHSVSQAA